MTDFFAILAYGVLGLIAIFSPLRRARQVVVVVTFLMFVLVHTEVEQSAVALLVALAINAFVVMRLGGTAGVPVFLGCALVWAGLREVFAAAQLEAIAVPIITALVLILLGGHVRRLGSDIVWSLQVIVVVTVVVQFISGIGERFLGANAPWPRRDGVTFNIVGSNNLWPELGGRAMGTMGWAITLGQMMAVCVVLAVWFFLRSRRWPWLLIAAGGVMVILLSGTRTGLLMVAAALLVALVARAKRIWVALLLTIGAVGAIAVGPLFLGDLFGFGGDVEGTRSVEHRRLVSGSIPDLLGQSFGSVLFGHGYDSVPGLLESGVIHGVAGVPVTDNEFIRTLAGLGLLGVLLWAGAFVFAFLRGTVVIRALVAALLVGAASYDTLTWRSLLITTVVVLSMNFDTIGQDLPTKVRARRVSASRAPA
ncbi:hypothetical protein ACFWHT_03325 [Microbacterium sp. NPDC058342]|uniref:hypothetical protein n=1 Tax=Microbacterium sp. NPDC058342 TaxID=3346454 RepID=UPI003653994C